MNSPTSITEDLLNDEVIQYIAQRHHVTVDDVMDSFIGNGHPKADLEDNEKNIIRDLIRMYNNK